MFVTVNTIARQIGRCSNLGHKGILKGVEANDMRHHHHLLPLLLSAAFSIRDYRSVQERTWRNDKLQKACKNVSVVVNVVSRSEVCFVNWLFVC